ncbi:GGDEF domain-containing protein [Pseudofrankia sp. BMG5.37]|nr:GGDEF domain-containing protein [Pseudofrankia sp. BMG5.36]MDT3439281.1 GGDEF domain-containing protein [Pseudofrankia sp. BMG5.37]
MGWLGGVVARLRVVGGAVPGLRRSAGWSHGPGLFRGAVVGGMLLVGLAAVLMALLGPDSVLIATAVAALASQVAAAVACFWSARHAAAGDRRWRVLVGVFAAGVAGSALVAVVTLLNDGSVASHSTSEYLALFPIYGLALVGLLCLPTYPVQARGERGRRGGTTRWHAIIVLDSVLIVGSVFLLEWGTGLEVVVRASAPEPSLLLLALAHQVTALILAAAVLLIATFRRPRSPATLALLGSGLLVYALTNGVVTYRVAQGHYDLPAWSLISYVVSFLLIALAALVPARARVDLDGSAPPGPRATWAHAALPYALLGMAGLLILGRLAAGAPFDWVEAYGTVSLLVLALARQMITLAENTHLLTEVRERERQLHYQAFHDPLTGLANRALFSQRLQRMVDPGADPSIDGAPTGREAVVSLLFVDLDQFKRVNDAFGHAVGDELLKISAARLRAGTRATDTVARLGGDEFAVILADAGPDRPIQVAERLATAVQAPCQLAGQTYIPRASFGLVSLDCTARRANPDTLLHQADLAMYTAKREQTGRPVVYDPDLTVHFDQDQPHRS